MTFEIHASDPERSMAFYKAVLGWEFIEHKFGDTSFWEIVTPNEDRGAKGRMIRRHGSAPQAGAPVMGAVITVDVGDLDNVSETALTAGGTIALPKFALPGVGWAAYFLDPDHNVFGVFQHDEAAR
jgi:hypothetical protein